MLPGQVHQKAQLKVLGSKGYRKGQSGQSLIEYGILLSLIVVVCVASFSDLGVILKDQLTLAYSYGDERPSSTFTTGGASNGSAGGTVIGGGGNNNGNAGSGLRPATAIDTTSLASTNVAPQASAEASEQTQASNAGTAEGEGDPGAQIGNPGSDLAMVQAPQDISVQAQDIANMFSADVSGSTGGNGIPKNIQVGNGSQFAFGVTTNSGISSSGSSGTTGVQTLSAQEQLYQQRAAGTITEDAYYQAMQQIYNAFGPQS